MTADYAKLEDAIKDFFNDNPEIEKDDIARINIGSAGCIIEKNITINNSK